MSEITYFGSPGELHDWLAANHDSARELHVGFYKRGSGKAGLTYAGALDEALAYGWIDGVRRRVDDERWTIRFTPRTARSIWSAVNIKRAGELVELGRMQAAGLAAFTERDRGRENQYSFENPDRELGEAYEARFQANEKAWAFFQTQPRSYRQPAIWWVISAKKEETRERRLATLIEDSANGLRLAQMRRP